MQMNTTKTETKRYARAGGALALLALLASCDQPQDVIERANEVNASGRDAGPAPSTPSAPTTPETAACPIVMVPAPPEGGPPITACPTIGARCAEPAFPRWCTTDQRLTIVTCDADQHVWRVQVVDGERRCDVVTGSPSTPPARDPGATPLPAPRDAGARSADARPAR
jgi:hypothetical protein